MTAKEFFRKNLNVPNVLTMIRLLLVPVLLLVSWICLSSSPLLEGWLFTHIRLNDMAYVESLKAAGIKEGCSSPQIVASKAFAARFISPRLSSRSHCVPPICRHSTAERSAESNSARISPTT